MDELEGNISGLKDKNKENIKSKKQTTKNSRTKSIRSIKHFIFKKKKNLQTIGREIEETQVRSTETILK